LSVEKTTEIMNAYLDALLHGGDFGQYFVDDVHWTTVETGDEVRGRDAVTDLIIGLHTQLFDAHPEFKKMAISDGLAALEADFVGVHTGEFAGIAPTGASLRAPYCVFYDVGDDGITSLRAYMPVRQIVAELQAAQGAPS
jgi:predicted ester cyclase